ncbi:MAG: hypothetical protein ACYDA5_11160 [Vulcanimicrobiaceae bacterium]
MKLRVLGAAATVLAVLLIAFSAHPASGNGMRRSAHPKPTPTHTPLFLQYNEISRMLLASAPVPAPGSFPADYAAIEQALNAPPSAPHGMGGMLGHMMGGKYAAAMQAANAAMMAMKYGTLTRYTYVHNCYRVDYPAYKTAVVHKCGKNGIFTLELPQKKWCYGDRPEGCLQSTGYGSGGGGSGGSVRGGTGQPQKGLADIKISSSSRALGPKTIVGYHTRGTQVTMHLKSSNATGACRDGETTFDVQRYASTIDKPRPYCPLRGVKRVPPRSVLPMMGGCKARRMNESVAGKGLGASRQLSLYTLMTFEAGGMMGGSMPSHGAGGKMHMLKERGNIAWLTKEEVKPLFVIPPGFTQVP